MRLNLLEFRPNGDLPRHLQVIIAVVSLTLAGLLFIAVRAHGPVASATAQMAMTALFVAAGPGFITLFSVVLKIFQGGRVQPTAQE